MSDVEREGRWWSVELNRRTLLRGGVHRWRRPGLAAALIGCGGDDDDDDDDTTATTQTSTAARARPARRRTSPATQASQTQAPVATTTTTRRTRPEDAEDYAIGKLVRDDSLPYPYQFPEPNKKPVPGGRMQVAATYRVQNFDPTTSAAGGTITVPNYVYNRLIGMKGGPEQGPVPDRAGAGAGERLGAHAGRPGLHVQPSVTTCHWQNLPPLNGRKFVAEDAKFAYDRYGQEGVHQSYWRNISSTEAPDDTTFKITMGTVTADFILPLASRYQTIFPRETVDAGNIDTVVVGTGPMILTEAVDGSHLSFDKNPDYWEREVLLDGHDVRLDHGPVGASRGLPCRASWTTATPSPGRSGTSRSCWRPTRTSRST